MSEFVKENTKILQEDTDETWKDSGEYSIVELLINIDDLYMLLDKEIAVIHDKIKKFGSNLGTKTHNIDCTLYDNVYIFSDIHADFFKFCQILFEYELIKINDTNKNDIINEIYSDLDADQTEEQILSMYAKFFHIIENIEWNGGEKTLIILVGDLVDGKRDNSEVYDPKGIFELLIHSLVHNIRIKSRENKSDMLFTFGNHDFFGCFYNDFPYLKYIHTSCKEYYKMDLKKRLLFLQPFYINSPYLFLNLQYNNETKIKCIHAGIHSEHGVRIPDNVLDESQTMLNSITFDNITQIHMINIKSIADTLLVVRPYYNVNDKRKDGCNFIKDDDPLLIIGHCPTAESMKTEIQNINSPEYVNCDYWEENLADVNKLNEFIEFRHNPQTKGCVVVGCNHENHTPKLIYVDSALSNSFRNHFIYNDLFTNNNANAEKNRITNNFNKTRHVEILKLSREGETPDAKYYYNILERLNSGEGNNISIYETPSDFPSDNISERLNSGVGNNNISIYETPSDNISELNVGLTDNTDNTVIEEKVKKGGKKTNKKYNKSYKKCKKQRKQTKKRRRTRCKK
jgi:hypothetical protein